MPSKTNYFIQSRNSVIIFLFPESGSSKPCALVKLNRDPTNNHAFNKWVNNVGMVRSMVTQELRSSIPKTYLLEPINGLLSIIQQYLPGKSFPLSLKKSSLHDNFTAFSNWLIEFQKCTEESKFTITTEFIESNILNPLSILPGIEKSHVAKTNKLLGNLIGLPLPYGWVYGDTHPSNILIENKCVTGAIDWEGSRPRQLQIYDWFQFLISTVQELLKKSTPDILERAVMACELMAGQDNSPLSLILKRQNQSFLSRCGLDTRLVIPLFLVFLIDYYWFEKKDALIMNVIDRIK